MKKDEVDFINDIHSKMSVYRNDDVITETLPTKNILSKIKIIFKSLIDYVILCFFIDFNNKDVFVIHTSNIKNSKDNFYPNKLKTNKRIYISYDKYNYTNKVENEKVFNIGILVNITMKLKIIKNESLQKGINNWMFILNPIVKKLKKNKVFIPAYSNNIGFSLLFNNHRKNYDLIEVQHGSVINYPPYQIKLKNNVLKMFYAKDNESANYLKNNFLKETTTKIEILDFTPIKLLPTKYPLHIIYISSYEYSFLHPTFIEILKTIPAETSVKIRLHPRQASLKEAILLQAQKLYSNIYIDTTENWYDEVYKNTCIISPLSSVIEEATNINLKLVLLDKLGKQRFQYLIDENKAVFIDNPYKFLEYCNL